MYKVSVVIPMYNAGKKILKTLGSIELQSVHNFEVIVVDDGSTDDSLRIVNDYAFTSDLNISIITQKNAGVSSARNRGLDISKGEYVLFLDSDDYVSNELINEICFNAIDCYDILCWKYEVVDSNGKSRSCSKKFPEKTQDIDGEKFLFDMFVNNSIWLCTGSAAFSRAFLQENKLRYTIGCVNGEDQEFHFKALTMSKKIRFINQSFFYYVQNDQSVSHSYNIRKLDSVDAFSRIIDRYHNERRLYKILEVIKNKLIVENFVYVFSTNCKALLRRGESIVNVVSIINCDFESNYPLLFVKIKKNLQEYKNGNFPVYLYRFSVILYVFTLKVKMLISK